MKRDLGPVPCDGCTLCCHRQAVAMVPEEGDRAADYQCKIERLPGSNKMAIMLDQTPDRDCIYLGDGCCSIYERRPHLCRIFDCRAYVLETSPAMIDFQIKIGLADAAIVARGRELLAKAKKGRK